MNVGYTPFSNHDTFIARVAHTKPGYFQWCTIYPQNDGTAIFETREDGARTQIRVPVNSVKNIFSISSELFKASIRRLELEDLDPVESSDILTWKQVNNKKHISDMIPFGHRFITMW